MPGVECLRPALTSSPTEKLCNRGGFGAPSAETNFRMGAPEGVSELHTPFRFRVMLDSGDTTTSLLGIALVPTPFRFRVLPDPGRLKRAAKSGPSPRLVCPNPVLTTSPWRASHNSKQWVISVQSLVSLSFISSEHFNVTLSSSSNKEPDRETGKQSTALFEPFPPASATFVFRQD